VSSCVWAGDFTKRLETDARETRDDATGEYFSEVTECPCPPSLIKASISRKAKDEM